MGLKSEYEQDANALAMLYIRSNSGQLVPLRAIASINQTVGPLSVAHLSALPSATISFDTIPGVSLSQATAAIQRAAAEVLPASVTASFQGVTQSFQQSFNDLGWLLLVSIVVIYLILALLWGDYYFRRF
jgi:hydrophobic/amphiphilic exporter-1 (mainly G- bacteria), HAE1 family